MHALDGRIAGESTMVKDSKPGYEQVAKYYDATLHQISADSYRKGVWNLGAINEIHSHLKTWFTKFKGVSTKYLDQYLAWFRFYKLMNYRIEKKNHKRFTMNQSIKEKVKLIITNLRSRPFPIDIPLPYS